MKKFEVLITESNHGTYIVEAENENEAQKLAEEAVWNSDALTLSEKLWDSTEVRSYEVNEVGKGEELTNLE